MKQLKDIADMQKKNNFNGLGHSSTNRSSPKNIKKKKKSEEKSFFPALSARTLCR